MVYVKLAVLILYYDQMVYLNKKRSVPEYDVKNSIQRQNDISR